MQGSNQRRISAKLSLRWNNEAEERKQTVAMVGASSGIGLATARAVVNHDAKVIMFSRRDAGAHQAEVFPGDGHHRQGRRPARSGESQSGDDQVRACSCSAAKKKRHAQSAATA